MNDFRTRPIYVWKCTRSQFDNAYNELINLLNDHINHLMMRVHFATSFREVDSLQIKIMLYERTIPEILKNIRYNLYDKFNKEIDKDVVIPISIWDLNHMETIKEIVTEFLNKIDCLYDYKYTAGMLYVKPKLIFSHQLIVY